MKISRSWLQTYFEEELPSAQELVDVLMFHAFEIEGLEQTEGDLMIDVDVLPNRSSDCLSHRGIARELATLLSLPMKREPLRDPLPAWDELPQLEVMVEDTTLCPRYMAAIVRGVTVGPSPAWLKERLEAIGQKSINNIVDATNYVMFELGQPLHVFDVAKLTADENSKRVITVRSAKEGEQITVLTGDTYTLTQRHLLITDGVADTPLALAGIKGGARAGIDPATTDIVLEAAHFDYVSVRKTSQELKLATDASLRFQNEPAGQLPAFALRDAIRLIEDIAGGKLAGVADRYEGTPEHLPIDITLTKINTILGSSLTYDDVERILVRFEWEFSRAADEFAVTPPWERTDLRIAENLIEEIGRVYAYKNIQAVLPERLAQAPILNKRYFYTEKLHILLTKLGYSEVYTYTLQDKGEVELKNPLASDKAFMRMSLRNGINDALDQNMHNAPMLNLATVKLYEVGTIFRARGEQVYVALGVRAVRGKQGKAASQLVEDLATIETALGVKLEATVEDGIAEFSLDTLLPALKEPEAYNMPLPWHPGARFKPWSQFPFVLRDIAVWVPADTTAEEVLAVIVERSPDTLLRYDLFDSFEKEGRISYAWHLVFQSKEKTLTDVEVGEIMDAVTVSINKKEGWEVR